MTAQVSITGETIPEERPPFVQPALTCQEHIEAAERLLHSLHRYYGNQDYAGVMAHGDKAEAYALMALAHALVAIARKP